MRELIIGSLDLWLMVPDTLL